MKILFIRVSSIGDVIHTLPALFLLKKKFSTAKISWVVQEKAAFLLKDQPFLDNLWILKDKFFHPKNIFHTLSIIKDIKKTNWDAIIDFQGIIKTSILLSFLKGKKFGFGFNHARQSFTSFLTNHHINPNYENIIQKNLCLAQSVINNKNFRLNLNSSYLNNEISKEELKADFSIFADDGKQNKINEYFIENKIDKLIILSPNTTWKSKEWPTTYWNKLCLLLEKNKNYKIALLGQNFGSQAKKIAEFIKKNNLNIICLPKWDLQEISILLKKSNLLIAPDTGILHLADFLGINSLGIFGPTLAKKHGPYFHDFNVKNVFQIDCPHQYQKNHFLLESSNFFKNCMFKLEPNQIIKKIEENLNS